MDPATKEPEPLLTFKRGALVQFAVSQYEVAMTTRLAGEATVFLPFNRGTRDGGAGNETPSDVNRYATEYLWNEVAVGVPAGPRSVGAHQEDGRRRPPGERGKQLQAAKKEKDALGIFKKDLGTFVRFYEFMSQSVDYDDTSLEKLSLYARHLSPLLRERITDDDEIDLNHVVLSHYRLSKIRQQDLMLADGKDD